MADDSESHSELGWEHWSGDWNNGLEGDRGQIPDFHTSCAEMRDEIPDGESGSELNNW
jgi:hypothetical protein